MKRQRRVTEFYRARDRRIEAVGWTYVSSRSCPRRLVRKHCRNMYEYGTCWCSHQLNDHGGTWIDNPANRRVRFVLWEPYGAGGEDLAEIIAAAAQDGLGVRIDTSVWNPEGRGTVGIRFAPKAAL